MLDVVWLVVASMFDAIARAFVHLIVLVDVLLSSSLCNVMWKMMALLPFLLLLSPLHDPQYETACALLGS
jgi:hypothetical protein